MYFGNDYGGPRIIRVRSPLQEEQEKGEQILSIRGKNVTTTIKDISHLGLILEQNSTLETEGEFEGAGFSTVTIHLKPDGSSQYEQKGFVNTPKGEFVALWGRGTGRNVSPTNATWEGEVRFMTQAPKLSSLNDTAYRVEGSGDQAEGEFRGNIFEAE